MKVDEDEIGKYLPGIVRKLEWLSGTDLLKRVVSLEFNRLLDYYKDAPETVDFVERKSRDRDERGGDRGSRSRDGKRGEKREFRRESKDKDSRTAEKGYERIYVNAGKADGFFPARLIETLNHNVDGRVDIGRIDLLNNYALFDVRKGDGRKAIEALTNARYFGKRLYAEFAEPGKDYAKASTRKSGGKGRGEYDNDDNFAKFKKKNKKRR